MKLENAIEGDDSQSKQATRGSKGKKTRRSFLASTAATAAVAGLGVVGTAAANDDAKYITLTNHFDERANYYLEVSGSLEKSERYNATVDDHDEFLRGGSAVSGHVHNGRDTYRYTGYIAHLGANDALDVEIDGQPTDPSEFLNNTITIEAPADRFADYDLKVHGYFVKSSGYRASIDPNDNIEAYVASGQVGYGGRDSYSTSKQVAWLSVEDSATVYLNGVEIEPENLPRATNLGTGSLWITDINAHESGKGLDNEYITFENISDEPLPLAGYYIQYGDTDESYTFPADSERVLDPGERITIRTTDGDQAEPNDVIAFPGRKQGVLDNEGGELSVLEPGGGQIIDVSYTVTQSGETVLTDEQA